MHVVKTPRLKQCGMHLQNADDDSGDSQALQIVKELQDAGAIKAFGKGHQV